MKSNDELREEFEMHWGLAPKLTAKYNAMQKAADFFLTQRSLDMAELDKNIGMLRQWLNEDRITDPEKMVTNAQIAHWFSLIPNPESL
jgi:hypothetical protein